MNEQNFEYLKDNIKYLGFGENLNEALLDNLIKGPPEFTLQHTAEMNRKLFEAVLHFKKSESSDLYFFNSYDAMLERKNGDSMEQTFYLNKGRGVTAKEAYNLLEGRAVYKDLSTKAGESYKAWIQLDFETKDKRNNFEVKQYHEKYGYDLKSAVSKFAVTELNDPEKEKQLLHSLQKGNIQAVTIEKEGFTHKMFIEANPQYKTVNLYDCNMKRVQKEDIGKYQAVPVSEIIKNKEPKIKQKQKKDRNQESGGDPPLIQQNRKRSGKKRVKL